MEAMFGFAALAMATIFGLFAALALQALLLRTALNLMQPAAATVQAVRPPLERGTQLAMRAYARPR